VAGVERVLGQRPNGSSAEEEKEAAGTSRLSGPTDDVRCPGCGGFDNHWKVGEFGLMLVVLGENWEGC
jgi:hypothetical protein